MEREITDEVEVSIERTVAALAPLLDPDFSVEAHTEEMAVRFSEAIGEDASSEFAYGAAYGAWVSVSALHHSPRIETEVLIALLLGVRAWLRVARRIRVEEAATTTEVGS